MSATLRCSKTMLETAFFEPGCLLELGTYGIGLAVEMRRHGLLIMSQLCVATRPLVLKL